MRNGPSGYSLGDLNSHCNKILYFIYVYCSAINPSDCVDMECDGMKKALLVDNDGSMVGGSGGSIIPQVRGLSEITRTIFQNLYPLLCLHWQATGTLGPAYLCMVQSFCNCMHKRRCFFIMSTAFQLLFYLNLAKSNVWMLYFQLWYFQTYWWVG